VSAEVGQTIDTHRAEGIGPSYSASFSLAPRHTKGGAVSYDSVSIGIVACTASSDGCEKWPPGFVRVAHVDVASQLSRVNRSNQGLQQGFQCRTAVNSYRQTATR
jgi:hypothetical protein